MKKIKEVVRTVVKFIIKWTIIVSVIAAIVAGILYYRQESKTIVVTNEITKEVPVGCATDKDLAEICNDPKFRKVEELRAKKMLANKKLDTLNANYKAEKAMLEAEIEQIRKEELELGVVAGSF